VALTHLLPHPVFNNEFFIKFFSAINFGTQKVGTRNRWTQGKFEALQKEQLFNKKYLGFFFKKRDSLEN